MDQRTTIKLLDDTFNHDFDLQRFSQFVKELFNKFTFTQKSWSVWQEYQDYIESYQLLGSYHDNSKKTVDVLVVKLKKTTSRDRARTMQRNFIAKYLGNSEKDAALVAFYGDDPQDWRFSFVKMEYQLVKDGEKVKVSKELTPAKRYSFLVGVNEPNHTCRRQFLSLVMEEEVSPSLEEIEKAFSIDNVTKEFFSEYKELFLKLKESLERVLESDKRVKKEFEEKNISSVDFAKKLLGQVVFIYFLQKKGWLGVTKDKSGAFNHWGTGPKNFLRRLFDKEIVHYDNFFNDILEPLFYEALATERDDDYYSRFNCKIPFLNGGLFEPINDYDWAGTAIVLDNAIFENIFSVFDRFNFTVKEDEPLEKEVAVDPEMLGKVFENLLDVTDRKSKGAFYTPREIVHYMCQQSLINYLETNSGILREDIEKFIQLGDLALAQIIKEQEQVKKYGKAYDVNEKYSIPASIKQNHQLVDKLLKEIKVVDPAVGSGAFPVGMMNEIVKARSILSIYFKEARNDYDLKRETIENCLYGVDIESSAVDIAKLRFWLTLIVDELDMKNIKPLPNLDHKIMCGNSLLEEFEGKKLFDEKLLGEVKKDYAKDLSEIGNKIKKLYDSYEGDDFEKELEKLEKERRKIEIEAKKDKVSSQATLDDSISKRIKESQRKLRELKELQQKFFNEQNRKLKKQLRDEIDKLEWGLVEETLKEEGNSAAIEKLQEYKKNKSKPFFLWKLYFAEVFQRENPGFDVVIGNPPYVQLQKEGGELANLFENARFSTFTKTGDIYMLFYEKGFQVLRSKGVLAFITSSQWMKAAYGRQLRRYLLTQNPQKIILLGPGVFETATVDTNILMGEKNSYLDELKGVLIKEIKEINSNIEGWLSLNCVSDDKWILLDPLKQKIRQKIGEKSKPLQKWNIRIYRGILTGLNEAFIIDETKRNELIRTDPNSEEIIRPILRGREIEKYFTKWESSYIIATFPVLHIEIAKFKAVKKYLESFLPKLNQTGETFTNAEKEKEKTRKKTGNKWFETQDQIGYYKEFSKEKIIWKRIGSQLRFSYSNSEIYCLDSTCIATGEKLKYVTALLNSKLCNYQMLETAPRTGMGDLIISVQALEPLLLHYPNDKEERAVVQILDQILSITKDNDYLDNPDKKAKVKRLENEIDQLVYKLYELTPEEIKIVEEFNGK